MSLQLMSEDGIPLTISEVAAIEQAKITQAGEYGSLPGNKSNRTSGAMLQSKHAVQARKMRKQEPVRNLTAEEQHARQQADIDRALIERGRVILQKETEQLIHNLHGNHVAQYFILVQRAISLRNQLVNMGRQTGKTNRATVIAPVVLAECTRVVELMPPHFQRLLLVNAVDMNPAPTPLPEGVEMLTPPARGQTAAITPVDVSPFTS